ncbi:hypothetical protein ABH932_007298 [Streptacidiphilus sp. MAP5-52]
MRRWTVAEPEKRSDDIPAPTQARVPRASDRKMNAYVEPDVQDAIKRAQFWTQTQPNGYRTFSDLVEDVLRVKAQELADEYNDGEPFPPIPDGKLRQGRPIGR